MANIFDTIETLLGKVEELIKRGEYRRAYICSRNVLGIVKTTDTGPEITSRVLMASAKSAYYFSRFDEAENHLNRVRTKIKINHLDCDNSLYRDIITIRSNILRRRGDYRGALKAISDCTDHGEDDEFTVNRLMITGLCLMELGEIDESREKLEAALGIATHAGNERRKCAVLLSIGLLSMRSGYLIYAADYFRRAIEISKRTEDLYSRGAASLNFAISSYRLGKFSDAIGSAEEALSAFQECEWKVGICRSYLSLGNIERCRGNLTQAMIFYGKADSIAGAGGFVREQALSAGYSGMVRLLEEKYKEAESCCLEALKIISGSSPRGDVAAEQYRLLGRIKMETGDFRQAEEYFEKALELSVGIRAGSDEGLVYWRMAELSFRSRDLAGGEKLFGKAAKTLKATGSDIDLAGVKLSYAENLLRYGSLEERSDPGQAEAAVGRLWYLLIETAHLVGNVELDSFRERTEKLLEKVYELKRKFSSVTTPGERGGRFVEVGFSPEFVLHEDIISVSGRMRDLLQEVEFASHGERPVLITGETGTGKELIARAVHRLSERAEQNFVAVNCSAIPHRLFESELFGHRKGCFSGAVTDRKGLFEEASGGSLFLDEVGELDPAQQAKLLRVLQEGKVRRVGENTEREVDVRLISATNRNLERKMEEGSIRKDFYFRINEEIVTVPPLRDRREDIVPLMAYCLCGNGNGNGRPLRIERNALKMIQRYPWPGNVREFISVIRRVRRLSRGGVITADILPERVRGSGPASGTNNIIRGCGREEKKKTLLKLLRSCNGNKTEVARYLGISRGTLYKELKQAGLSYLIG